MRCPICGKDNKNPPFNRWTYNVFDVSRYKCSECSESYNVYVGEHKKFTIPKNRK